MKDKVIKATEDNINKIINEGIRADNLDHLYKLIDIYKDVKEVENMNYGNYGARRPGYDSYGDYNRDSYGRRGYDMRYRGDEHLDRIAGEYDRYMESRSRYGTSEETDKSFHYMVKALEDFIMVLHEEAETPQQKQMLNETLQRSMR